MDDDPTDSYEARAKKRKMAMKKAQEVRSSLSQYVFFVALHIFPSYMKYSGLYFLHILQYGPK